jgi:3-hydroxyisobutyrate dehydrogenase
MSPASAVRLGFIGIGKMGSGMTSNLLKAGYKLFVCDTNPDAVTQLSKQGAQIVEKPSDLGTIPGKLNFPLILQKKNST